MIVLKDGADVDVEGYKGRTTFQIKLIVALWAWQLLPVLSRSEARA